MLSCNASGFPAPSIVWQHPTDPELDLSNSSRFSVSATSTSGSAAGILPTTQSYLEVRASSRIDTGMFTCVATTPVSSVSEGSSLTVFGMFECLHQVLHGRVW